MKKASQYGEHNSIILPIAIVSKEEQERLKDLSVPEPSMSLPKI